MKKWQFWVGIFVYLLGQAIVGVSLQIKINDEFQRTITRLSEQIECQLTKLCEEIDGP